MTMIKDDDDDKLIIVYIIACYSDCNMVMGEVMISKTIAVIMVFNCFRKNHDDEMDRIILFCYSNPQNIVNA